MEAEVVSLLLAAYLYGAMPFVYFLGRSYGFDLRNEGSQNVGGTNLLRTVGPLQGVLGAALDVSKGVLPVLVARALDLNEGVAGLAAIAALAGQCWPIFLRFRGGRGISVAAGAVLVISPVTLLWAVWPTLAGFAVYFVTMRRQPEDVAPTTDGEAKNSRTVPLFMMISVVILPIVAASVGEPNAVVLTFMALSLVIALRRLTAGLRQDRGSPTPLFTRLRNRFLYDRAQV
jgi:acyl-phosphate glycerol 3-phosphate acyltransferase